MILRLRELQPTNTNAISTAPSANNASGAEWAWAEVPQPTPPQTLSEERLRELLMKNRFCRGVGGKGKKYQCGGEADESAINNAVELLDEAIRRVRRWRVWDPWWVEEWMDEWLEKRDRLEVQLRGKYSEEVVNAITGLVDKFIDYNEQFLNYWHEVGSEVKKLIDDLLNGKAEVVIRGEDTSGISVYREHITLETDRASNDGITIQLVLDGLEGVTIMVPDIFIRTMSEREYEKFVNELLVALRDGIEEADGYVESGKAAMGTTQLWQAFIWSLLYPGEVYMRVHSVNVNKEGVTVRWQLRSTYKPLKGKGMILSNARKLGMEMLLAFMTTAILGDGTADVEKHVSHGYVHDTALIGIAISSEDFEMWKPLLNKLWDAGFRWTKPNSSKNVIEIKFNGSNAIDLARVMISVLPPILRDILDALDFEKWKRIRQIAEMKVKWRRGEMQITIANIKFTVHVYEGTVVLEHKAKDGAEVEKVIETLKVVYGDDFVVNINKGGKYLLVIIPMYVFEKYDDIRAQVIEVLCRKLEKTKDERKRQIIAKHLRRLSPTKGGGRGFIYDYLGVVIGYGNEYWEE